LPLLGPGAGLVLAAAEPVVIGTEAPFPAYTYLASRRHLTGFDRDLMDEICARTAMDCDWQNVTFDQLIPGVMEGRLDVVLGGIAVTPGTSRPGRLSPRPTMQPIPTNGTSAPRRARSRAALIAVQSGTMHEAHLREMGYRHLSPTDRTRGAGGAGRGPGRPGALARSRPAMTCRRLFDAGGYDLLYDVRPDPDEGTAMALCKGNDDAAAGN
jgi:polar amino acid transport system substrate-binding protein